MSESGYWSEFMTRRLSRRRLLQAGAVGGAGLLVGSALGCGSASSNGSTQTAPAGQSQATATPKKGGTLRVALAVSEPVGVDPYVTNNFATPVYERLVRHGPNRETIIPDLAEGVETPDETTYLFHLKKGVKFQNVDPVNGREMTAEDVKFSLLRALSEGPQYSLRSSFSAIDKVDAVDSSTVKVTTKAPFAPMLNKMAFYGPLIQPKEIIGADNMTTKAVGTGAFIFDQWNKGEKMVFRRNPDFHIAGQPYLDGVEYRWAVDYTALDTVFISDQCDVTANYAQDTKIIKGKRPNVQRGEVSALSQHCFIFKAGFKPTDDVRVRQAMDLVVPRWEIANRVAGGTGELFGGTAAGPLSNGMTNWVIPMDELQKKPGYMQNFPKADAVAQAKKLMADAGYANGFDVKFLQSPEPYEVLIAQMCQEWWKEIGIRMTINPTDWTTFIATGMKGDFELTMYVVAGEGDPDTHLYPILRSGSVNNWGKWNDPKLDKMLDDQRSTMDVAKRKSIVLDLQRYILDQVPRLYIYDWHTFIPMRENLRDFQALPYATFAGWEQFPHVWFA